MRLFTLFVCICVCSTVCIRYFSALDQPWIQICSCKCYSTAITHVLFCPYLAQLTYQRPFTILESSSCELFKQSHRPIQLISSHFFVMLTLLFCFMKFYYCQWYFVQGFFSQDLNIVGTYCTSELHILVNGIVLSYALEFHKASQGTQMSSSTQ